MIKINVLLLASILLLTGCQSLAYYKAKQKCHAAERKWLNSDIRYDTNNAALYEEYSLDYFNMINLEK